MNGCFIKTKDDQFIDIEYITRISIDTNEDLSRGEHNKHYSVVIDTPAGTHTLSTFFLYNEACNFVQQLLVKCHIEVVDIEDMWDDD